MSLLCIYIYSNEQPPVSRDGSGQLRRCAVLKGWKTQHSCGLPLILDSLLVDQIVSLRAVKTCAFLIVRHTERSTDILLPGKNLTEGSYCTLETILASFNLCSNVHVDGCGNIYRASTPTYVW